MKASVLASVLLLTLSWQAMAQRHNGETGPGNNFAQKCKVNDTVKLKVTKLPYSLSTYDRPMEVTKAVVEKYSCKQADGTKEFVVAFEIQLTDKKQVAKLPTDRVHPSNPGVEHIMSAVFSYMKKGQKLPVIDSEFMERTGDYELSYSRNIYVDRDINIHNPSAEDKKELQRVSQYDLPLELMLGNQLHLNLDYEVPWHCVPGGCDSGESLLKADVLIELP